MAVRVPLIRFAEARRTITVATVALLGAVGVVATHPSAAVAARATPIQNSEIVAAARSAALGSHGGQCKVWAAGVIDTVLAAHGRGDRVGGWGTPGGAYYGAWQRAGGMRVSQAQVRPGDVVQIVNAAEKNSDFPAGALHSAIVVGLTGTPGTFVLRDSNWRGEESVFQHRLDPSGYARAHGSTAYYWRFGSVTPQVHGAEGLFWSTTGGVPISGDWDGDGRADIGVVVGNTFALALTTGKGTKTYRKISYGAGVGKSRVPITGDWNGDGVTDVGWQHGSAFRLLLLNENGKPYTYKLISFGRGVAHNDIPITGDWNGDGVTDIGYVRGGAFHLALVTKKGKARAYRTIKYGAGAAKGDLPITGDWNGDGRSDIGYRRGRVFTLGVSGHAALAAGRARDLRRITYGAAQLVRR